MTMPDLPHRPGHASETRQMVERGRTDTSPEISGRAFVIALTVVAAVIATLAFILE